MKIQHPYLKFLAATKAWVALEQAKIGFVAEQDLAFSEPAPVPGALPADLPGELSDAKRWSFQDTDEALFGSTLLPVLSIAAHYAGFRLTVTSAPVSGQAGLTYFDLVPEEEPVGFFKPEVHRKALPSPQSYPFDVSAFLKKDGRDAELLPIRTKEGDGRKCNPVVAGM